MLKKQKQRKDHTFTTCKDVKNENEHCLNHVLGTEVTCNSTCTQHKFKCPNKMNEEIDHPHKKKKCMVENHNKYELKTSGPLESSKEENGMEIEDSTDILSQTNESFHESHEKSFETIAFDENIDNKEWAKENMMKFHASMDMNFKQCTVCKEPWPMTKRPIPENEIYLCHRCKRDKGILKKFSFENSVIPSPVPKELQGLTQFEEMLIAMAFPIIHVYTKPRGGQRAYKGHVITMSQNVQQLADVLPTSPEEIPVIVFNYHGKDNQSKD